MRLLDVAIDPGRQNRYSIRMTKPSRAIGMLAVLPGLLLARPARADLPPPPGQTQIEYSVRVTGAPQGVVLVAFPTYVSGGGSVAKVSEGQEIRLAKGYAPGIYSLPAEDAASLAGKEREEIEKVLASKAHACVRRLPRVFTVPTETKITSMIDVLHIDASPAGCKASLAKTVYGGDGGAQGEGGIDPSGRRTAPAPFSAEGLPVVTELGGPPATPSSTPTATPTPAPTPTSTPTSTPTPTPTAPPQAGCAGCTTSGTPVNAGSALALLALASFAVRRTSPRGRSARASSASRRSSPRREQ